MTWHAVSCWTLQRRPRDSARRAQLSMLLTSWTTEKRPISYFWTRLKSVQLPFLDLCTSRTKCLLGHATVLNLQISEARDSLVRAASVVHAAERVLASCDRLKQCRLSMCCCDSGAHFAASRPFHGIAALRSTPPLQRPAPPMRGCGRCRRAHHPAEGCGSNVACRRSKAAGTLRDRQHDPSPWSECELHARASFAIDCRANTLKIRKPIFKQLDALTQILGLRALWPRARSALNHGHCLGCHLHHTPPSQSSHAELL